MTPSHGRPNEYYQLQDVPFPEDEIDVARRGGAVGNVIERTNLFCVVRKDAREGAGRGKADGA